MNDNDISTFLSTEQDTLSLLLPNDTENKPEPSDSIYLSNIYDLISDLHLKISSLQNKATIQDSVAYHYNNLSKFLQCNRARDAKNYLKALCNKNDEVEEKSNELYLIFCRINEHVKFLENKFFEVRGMILLKDTEYFKKEESERKVRKAIRQFFDFSNEVQKILKIRNNPEETDSSIVLSKKEEGLRIEFNKLFISDTSDFSQNLADENVKNHIQEKHDDNSQTGQNCKNDYLNCVETKLFDKEIHRNILRNLKKIVMHNQTLEDENVSLKAKGHAKSEKILQEENLSLQEKLNDLTEKNVKLKKENVLLSNELKLQKDANRKRQSALEKQKKIIEILQSKFGKENENNHFVEELKGKIDNLRIEIGCERNNEIRNKKISEMVDCEKRLMDFLRFVKKE